MYASVVLNGDGITNPIPFLTTDLEIFAEILVKDIYMLYNKWYERTIFYQ
jgi:hypothetical protein